MSPLTPRRVIKNRFFISALIIIYFCLAAYPLSRRLVSQILYKKAVHLIQDGQYTAAIEQLEHAARYQTDNPRVWKKLGEAYTQLGQSHPAKKAYAFAIELNSIDAEAIFGLAQAEASLEQMYRDIYAQKDAEYNATPYFQEALRLRPNGILYHHVYARYLYIQRKTDALLDVVENLVRIYPPAYKYLKTEPFWSQEVRLAVKKGLQQAVEEDTFPQSAHFNLSDTLSEEKDWSGAILHYYEAMGHGIVDPTPDDYLHLGRLYMKNNQIQQAEENFLTALSKTRMREEAFERIQSIYKSQGYDSKFYQFYEKVKDVISFSGTIDIIVARTLIELDQYDQARQILNHLNKTKPTAAAYYWLYHIANLEKDSDSMELAIQKATVLDPQNSQYHLIFSQVLNRLKKLVRAEDQADLAIKYANTPEAGIFNQRASVRWNRKNYTGALEDWESAISLNPDRAYYYARAAEAYLLLGKFSLCLNRYEKALFLDPKNKNYKTRYQKLKDQLK